MVTGEARRKDLGWQSEGVVLRRHWRQTDRGTPGTLGLSDVSYVENAMQHLC